MAIESSRKSVLDRYLAWTGTTQGVQRLINGLYIVCALLFVGDLVIHRHAKVPGEGFFGYHVFVGFVAFTLIVLGARWLRTIIRRPENYYGEHGVDSEEYPDSDLGKGDAP